MLPSKGYFKDLLCPYFDKPNGETCFRPFCHYNHIPRVIREIDNKQTETATPVYTPTLLKPLPCLTPNIVAKNKVTLEYQPEKPSFDASPSKPYKFNATPAYVPSTTTSRPTEECIDAALLDLDACEDELNELTDLIDTEFLQPNKIATSQIPSTSQQNAITIKKEKVTDDLANSEDCIVLKEEVDTVEISDDEDKDPVNNNNNSEALHKSNNVFKIKKEKNVDILAVKTEKIDLAVDSALIKEEKLYELNENTKESSHNKEKLNHHERHKSKEHKSSTNSSRSRHSSTSSSRHHNHHQTKSHTDKDRNKSSKDKEKRHNSEQKYKDNNKTKDDKNNDKHTDRHHSKDRDKHKKREKDSNTHRHKDQTKEHDAKDIKKKHDKQHDNQLLSSKLEQKSSIKRISKAATSTITSSEVNANNSNNNNSIFMFSEEDIQNECLSIFNEIEAQFAHKDEKDSGSSSSSKNNNNNSNSSSSIAEKRKNDDIDELSAGCITQKKRIAHENADRGKPIAAPTNVQRPNHIRNAMQAIHERREQLRLRQVEEAAIAAEALKEAEEKVRLANEALRKVKEESEKKLTPLIPSSYLLPPSRPARSIAPISNMLALERAKRKVDELKAVKTLGFTTAQTSKIGARVAHTTTVLASSKTKVDPILPKPPVLESNSTKISFNIRMQYYDMMVKHCLAIYPNVPDAWQRVNILIYY